MSVAPQVCPECDNDCKLNVVMDDANYATLPDRLLGLSDMPCYVICTTCGHRRDAIIRDLDVELATGTLRFGTIIYQQW